MDIALHPCAATSVEPNATSSHRRRRRRIATLLSGSAMVATTALFASVDPKLPPFRAD